MDEPVATLVHTDLDRVIDSVVYWARKCSSGPGSRSSAGERPLHTRDVVGSIPTATTTEKRQKSRVRDVYFVHAMTLGLIKIGVTNDWRKRLASLQTFSPDKLELLGLMVCPAGGAMEVELHHLFHEHRSHGEWFRPGDSLLDFMVEHCLSPDDADAERHRAERANDLPHPPRKDPDE